MSNLLGQRIVSLCSKNSGFKYGSLKTSLVGGVLPNSRVAPSGSLISPRLLYTANYLGVDAFENQRSKVGDQFGHLKDNLIERMKSTIEGKNKMIFSEDLKNSIFLVSNQPEDVALLKKVISRYTEQATDIKFSTYQFGPVVMRLFYLFGDCDLAYEMIMDPKYTEFFNQERSFLICMDLCWEQGKYQQILDLYTRFRSIEGRNIKYPKDIMTLVAAACFKQNTPEAYKYCLDLFVEAREAKVRLTRRAISFFSCLALRQKDPEVALECLTLVDNAPNSAVILSIRLMALSHLKRVEDILYIIRNVINRGRPLERPIFISDAINAVSEAVASSENPELKNEWENIKRTLEENKLIQENAIEPILCNPIDRTIRQDQQQQFRQGFAPRMGSSSGGYGSPDSPRENRYRAPRNDGRYSGGGGFSNRYSGGGYQSGYQGGNQGGYQGGNQGGYQGGYQGGNRRNADFDGPRRRDGDFQQREEGY